MLDGQKRWCSGIRELRIILAGLVAVRSFRERWRTWWVMLASVMPLDQSARGQIRVPFLYTYLQGSDPQDVCTLVTVMVSFRCWIAIVVTIFAVWTPHGAWHAGDRFGNIYRKLQVWEYCQWSWQDAFACCRRLVSRTTSLVLPSKRVLYCTVGCRVYTVRCSNHAMPLYLSGPRLYDEVACGAVSEARNANNETCQPANLPTCHRFLLV